MNAKPIGSVPEMADVPPIGTPDPYVLPYQKLFFEVAAFNYFGLAESSTPNSPTRALYPILRARFDVLVAMVHTMPDVAIGSKMLDLMVHWHLTLWPESERVPYDFRAPCTLEDLMSMELAHAAIMRRLAMDDVIRPPADGAGLSA